MATRSTDKPASAAPARPAPALPSAGKAPALDPRLLSELGGARWEQSWELLPTLHTAAFDPGARQRFWTLAEMMRPHVRDAFALAQGPTGRTALDLRCGEGWLAHRLLDWGARRVVAVDDRPGRLRRARLLRDHFAIRSAELELIEGAEFSAAAREGTAERFDVVLLTGALDLAADPATLARAFESTAAICAIECAGDQTNAAAEAALAAGFGSVDRMIPPLQGSPVYVVGDRDLLIARVAIGR